MVGRRAWIALALLGLLGCGPAQPTDEATRPGTNIPIDAPTSASPVVVPTPTFLCTPEAGGSSSPCSEDEHGRAAATDAQYERAEAVYRAYLAEYIRMLRAGGARELSPTLRRILGDPVLAKNALTQLRQFKSGGVHLEGADPEVPAPIRKPRQARNGSTLALQFCVDARSLAIYRGSTRVNRLRVSRETVFFRADAANSFTIVAGIFQDVRSCTG